MILSRISLFCCGALNTFESLLCGCVQVRGSLKCKKLVFSITQPQHHGYTIQNANQQGFCGNHDPSLLLPDIIIFSTEEHQSQEPQPNSTFIQDYFSQNLQHVAQHAQFEVERTRLRNAANQPYVAPRKRHTSAALPRSHLEKFFLSSHPELDRLLLSRASFVKSVLCSEPGLWTL